MSESLLGDTSSSRPNAVWIRSQYPSHTRPAKTGAASTEFASARPYLVAEWSPLNEKPPSAYGPRSHAKVFWTCSLDERHQWQATLASRMRGSGCPYCSGRRASAARNLAVMHPDLAAQWHPSNLLMPTSTAPSSRVKVCWVCPKGHDWSATVNSRANGSGCPACAKTVASAGYNLADMHPDIAAQWSARNENSPGVYTPGSGAKVWWTCDNGHEWQARIQHRTRGSGCPFCAGRGSK